jgi:hypothetical protein
MAAGANSSGHLALYVAAMRSSKVSCGTGPLWPSYRAATTD